MKKTLIIVAHPDIERSNINKIWVEEVKKHPDQFTVNELYRNYADFQIDVKKEQALIEAHRAVVFQFPNYWFSIPPLLKKWLDDVLTYGWAYGTPESHALQGYPVGVAISSGSVEKDYTREGKNGQTLAEVLLPFEMTFRFLGARFYPYHTFWGAEHDPKPEAVHENARQYIRYLNAI